MVERWVTVALGCAAGISIATTVGIVFSVLFESIRFFQQVPLTEFLFGLQWSPQTAMRADQVGSSGAFGAVPLFAGTLLITAIAMLVAGPIGMFSAIYLSQYAASGVPRRGQADAGDPGRHPDRRLRLLRGADRGAVDPRASAQSVGLDVVVGERARGRRW